MKTCYVDIEHRAIADLVRPGELTTDWTITRINVPKIFRGNGYGSALLRRILVDADQEQLALQLFVLSSGELDREQLTAWYERYGFRMTESGNLRRDPVCD